LLLHLVIRNPDARSSAFHASARVPLNGGASSRARPRLAKPKKGPLSIALRRQQSRRPYWQAEWAIPLWRAHEGRDCRTAKIQRAAENPPRWPDMNLAAKYKSEAPC
jgi:hypothetical protein